MFLHKNCAGSYIRYKDTWVTCIIISKKIFFFGKFMILFSTFGNYIGYICKKVSCKNLEY